MAHIAAISTSIMWDIGMDDSLNHSEYFLINIQIIFEEKTLESDFRNRKDLLMLRENKISEAQNAKEDIEAAQRKDAKLREVNRENKWAWIECLGMIRINFIYIN